MNKDSDQIEYIRKLEKVVEAAKNHVNADAADTFLLLVAELAALEEDV